MARVAHLQLGVKLVQAGLQVGVRLPGRRHLRRGHVRRGDGRVAAVQFPRLHQLQGQDRLARVMMWSDIDVHMHSHVSSLDGYRAAACL